MNTVEKIKDKFQRNYKIYSHAYKAGRILGMGYTWLLWKQRTEFLFHHESNLDDKKKEMRCMSTFMESFCDVLVPYIDKPIYSSVNETKVSSAEPPVIWIYWNDDSYMPQMVKNLINQIREHSNGAKVVVVTEETVTDYVQFDDVVWRKYKEGKISLTHFSDLLRVSLLYRYGGVYMDSTLWLIRPLPKCVTDSDFYTYRSDDVDETNASRARWSSFFIACHKGNLMMKAALDVFVEYWHRYDYLVDYVLIDYTFNLLYDKIPSVRNMIDAVPVNNTNIWQLQPCVHKAYSETDFKSLFDDKERFLYKLSYKDSIVAPMFDANGNRTLKGWLCEDGSLLQNIVSKCIER